MKLFSVFSFAALAVTAAVAQEISPTPSSCGTIPSSAAYPTTHKLPDPFLLANGSRASTKDAWACKRAEILDQFQTYELGPKPTKPNVTATYSGNSLAITASSGGKSVSFSVSIKLPSSGIKPYPAIIGLGGGSIPYPSGVAAITYNNQDIAADDGGGAGKFYDLYGKTHPAGGLAAWAWGVSRVIDALEQLPASTTGVDARRLGVTGCSRNGKGAMVAGALDARVALTIPQEGGSGGAGCWRIVADVKKNGTKVEDATQIIRGDGWFAAAFSRYAPNVDVLPYDHHMLEALVAPRGLLVIENSGIDYLGPVSTYGCSVAGRLVYEALGVKESMGFSQASHGSSHCSMPSSQQPEVTAFINKFLLGQASVTTDVFKTDGKFSFTQAEWVDWTLPHLS